MNNLGAQVNDFRRKLNRINDSQKKEDVIEKTNIIARQLAKIAESLESQVQFLNAINFINKRYENSRSYDEIFQNNNEYHAHLGTLEFKKQISLRLETLISMFHLFRKEWEKLEYKMQQQESFTDTRDSLELLVKILTQNNNLHWDNWLKILDTEIKIEEEFLEKQRHNPSQKENYEDFHEKLNRFKTKRKEREKSSQLAQDIQRLATELADIKASFDLSDFPKEVEKFFKSVDNRYETATLEYLTPEVLQWITEHNYLKNFKVERKL